MAKYINISTTSQFLCSCGTTTSDCAVWRRNPSTAHSLCTPGGGLPVCPVCGEEIDVTGMKVCNTNCPGWTPGTFTVPVSGSLISRLRTGKPDWTWSGNVSAPVLTMGAAAVAMTTARKVAVKPAPVQDDEMPKLLSPEEVEKKRAVLSNRCAEALALAQKLGHQVNRYLVMDVRSQQPLVIPCGKCGFNLIIEQRTHPVGHDPIHGPASALDCKPPKK